MTGRSIAGLVVSGVLAWALQVRLMDLRDRYRHRSYHARFDAANDSPDTGMQPPEETAMSRPPNVLTAIISNNPEQRAAATQCVRRYAADRDDEQFLLDVLGLTTDTPAPAGTLAAEDTQ